MPPVQSRKKPAPLFRQQQARTHGDEPEQETTAYNTKSGYPSSESIPSRQSRPAYTRPPVPAPTTPHSQYRRGSATNHESENRQPNPPRKVPDTRAHHNTGDDPTNQDDTIPHKFARRVDDSRLEPAQRQVKPIKREPISLEDSMDSGDQRSKPTSRRVNEDESFENSSYTGSDEGVLQKPTIDEDDDYIEPMPPSYNQSHPSAHPQRVKLSSNGNQDPPSRGRQTFRQDQNADQRPPRHPHVQELEQEPYGTPAVLSRSRSARSHGRAQDDSNDNGNLNRTPRGRGESTAHNDPVGTFSSRNDRDQSTSHRNKHGREDPYSQARQSHPSRPEGRIHHNDSDLDSRNRDEQPRGRPGYRDQHPLQQSGSNNANRMPAEDPELFWQQDRRPVPPVEDSRVRSKSHAGPARREAGAVLSSTVEYLYEVEQSKESMMKKAEFYKKCYERSDDSTKSLITENKELKRDLKAAESDLRELREEMVETKHKEEAKRTKLIERVTRRMMEADLIIESAETRIKRMEVVQDAHIEEGVALKESVKQLQIIHEQSVKAAASGKKALDFAIEFRGDYQALEKELGDFKGKFSEVKNERDEAQKAVKSKEAMAWEGIDKVADKRDVAMMRLDGSVDPVARLVQCVVDKQASYLALEEKKAECEAEVKAAKSQVKIDHAHQEVMAKMFDTILHDHSQEELSRLMSKAKDRLAEEKRARDELESRIEDLIAKEISRSQIALAAQGEQSEYERRLSALQDEVENERAKAKSLARNVTTLQKELNTMQDQAKRYKEDAESSRRQEASARTSALAASSEMNDAKKEVSQLKTSHEQEIKLRDERLQHADKEIKELKDKITVLEQKLNAGVVKVNGIGVSPSAAAAEEKRRLEYTISDLKSKLFEKTQQLQLVEKNKQHDGKSVIERYEQGKCTDEENALIRRIDKEADEAFTAKLADKLKASKEEIDRLKMRIEKLTKREQERIAQLRKAEVSGEQSTLSDLESSRKDLTHDGQNNQSGPSTESNANSDFVPASSVLKGHGKKRPAPTTEATAAPKKTRFCDLPTSSDAPDADLADSDLTMEDLDLFFKAVSPITSQEQDELEDSTFKRPVPQTQTQTQTQSKSNQKSSKAQDDSDIEEDDVVVAATQMPASQVPKTKKAPPKIARPAPKGTLKRTKTASGK